MRDGMMVVMMLLVLGTGYAQELEPGILQMNNVRIPSVYSCGDNILGDINSDGKVTVIDASIIMQYQKGLAEFADIGCVDVDCNDEVSEKDAAFILQYAAGLIEAFPQCEEGEDVPPDIFMWGVIPAVGEPGTFFTLLLGAEDRSPVTVQAEISGISFKFTQIADLFDDGLHNDDAPNDGIFGYVLDSSQLPEGEYQVQYTATDAGGEYRKAHAEIYFKIQVSRDCKTILSNGDPSEKIDLMFVGDNFQELDDFYRAVGYQLSLDGKSRGMFSVEPLLSNKDKFNVYAFDQLSNFNCRDENGHGSCERDKEIIYAAHNCPVDIYSIISTNIFRSNAYFGERSLTSVGASEAEWVEGGATSTHEFGHAFGLLYDEYTERNLFLFDGVTDKNCYADDARIDWDCGSSVTCYSGDACLSGCEGDADCLLAQTCARDGQCKKECNPTDEDCLIMDEQRELNPGLINFYGYCSGGDLCNAGCNPPDPDCRWATCSGGDECVIGCAIIDPDCGGGKSCDAGDGCRGYCDPPDPDCGRATCGEGNAEENACLFGCAEANEGLGSDYDCHKFKFSDDGYTGDPYITCAAGDGCMIGCTPIDPDCGGGLSCNTGDGCMEGCFSVTTKDYCNENAQWSDLIGNSCGEDSVIDCQQGIDANYDAEINCNSGCYYTTKNRFRPNANSIMRNHIFDPFLFGQVNEREICREIRDWTGKVEGHCATLCIDGCQDGQKCVQGACQ